MRDSKLLTIIGYILIFILLSPIIAASIYLAIGGSLFYFIVIYSRVKYGKSDVRAGKEYKLVSTLLTLAAILVVYIVYRKNGLEFDIFTWRDFFVCQGIAFISFLPLVWYHKKRIDSFKANKNWGWPSIFYLYKKCQHFC